MTPNKPDPTNGEEKMREEWAKHAVIDDEYESFDVRHFAPAISQWWLAQLKSSHLALLEQIVGDMPREHSHAEPTLREHCNSYCGFNLALDQINTDLRIKIEELKKQQS